MVSTVFIWFRREVSGGPALVNIVVNVRVTLMAGISWVAERLELLNHSDPWK
jgi:hypothetical protein